MAEKTSGQIAYEAGAAHMDARVTRPEPRETWSELDPRAQRYWEAIGEAVGAAQSAKPGLSQVAAAHPQRVTRELIDALNVRLAWHKRWEEKAGGVILAAADIEDVLRAGDGSDGSPLGRALTLCLAQDVVRALEALRVWEADNPKP